MHRDEGSAEATSIEQQWRLKRRSPSDLRERMPGLDPVVARVLYARKIDTPAAVQAFLRADDAVGDPMEMADMPAALARIQYALEARERIIVYGDFDADGVCATALLVSGLRSLGANVGHYIPDRFDEGYGLNRDALEYLRDQGAQLVITVDCGVRSVAEAERAREIGLDLIVTDHHSLGSDLPPAVAVIDPKREDCAYPFKELAGVGLAYQLVSALYRAAAGSGGQVEPVERYLDLVALGTVADVAPLLGENRTLVRRGLAVLGASERPGLRALIAASDLRPSDIDSQAIGFRLGPRINAAGRLATAQVAYDLMMTTDKAEAEAIAHRLDAINRERQELLARQLQLAREQLGDGAGEMILIVQGPEYHEGIVGLIAGRLTEGLYRPSLVMKRNHDTATGSARSIETFHITKALDACKELLLRHGGHARAAGLTLPTHNLPALVSHLKQYAAAHLDASKLQRRFLVDAIVPLDEIHEGVPEALAALEPFGEGNPEPSLATLGLKLLSMRTCGQAGKHLRMEVSDGSRAVPVIAFRQGDMASRLRLGQSIDLVYRPTINEWRGQRSLQLSAHAIRPSATPRMHV